MAWVLLFTFSTIISYFMSQAIDLTNNYSKLECDRQIALIKTTPVLRRSFKDANANIPRDLSSQRVFTSNVDFNKCMAIDQTVNDTKVQGKYCSLLVMVPNILRPELLEYLPDNETLARAEENRVARQGYRFFVMRDCPATIFQKTITRTTKKKGMNLGICVPAVCSIENALEFVIDNRPFTYEDQIINEFEFQDDICRIIPEKYYTSGDYITIFVFGVILIITAASTIYDVKHQIFNKSGTKPNRVYSSFSIYTNTRRLVNSSSRTTTDAVLCVNGIRSISIAWETAGHVNRNNLPYLHEQWSDAKHCLYETGHYVVDTFFLLSGFFIVYTNIRKYTAASFVKNIPQYYLNRLIRLYPILCALILLDISIFKHLRDAYAFTYIINKIFSCEDLWWTTLLFIHNIVFTCNHNISVIKSCMYQAWYLAVDMQLYIISPLVMVWLFRTKKAAWIALTVALVLSLTACTVLTYLWNFPFLTNSSLLPHNNDEMFTFFYNNTLYRSPPYFIGMILGYYLHCLKKKKNHINKIFVCFIWFFIFFIFGCTFYGTKAMVYTYNQTINNLLFAYQRSLWCLAVALVIFTCQCGYGGPVNWFLSLNMWKLLSRLNYAMYLSHFQIAILIKFANLGLIVPDPTIWVGLQQFATLYMLSFVVSLVLVAVIEMPVMNLHAVILSRNKKKQIVKEENNPDKNIENNSRL